MTFTKIPILLPLLFMKKLLILSTSFVSLMSTTNVFFLRLYRFIQLLNTSSVMTKLPGGCPASGFHKFSIHVRASKVDLWNWASLAVGLPA